jgi:hypothetical protein
MNENRSAESTPEQLLQVLDMQLSVQRARRQQTSSKRTAWRIFGILFILVGAIAALLILQYAMNELTSRDPGGKRRTEAGESAARNF